MDQNINLTIRFKKEKIRDTPAKKRKPDKICSSYLSEASDLPADNKRTFVYITFVIRVFLKPFYTLSSLNFFNKDSP